MNSDIFLNEIGHSEDGGRRSLGINQLKPLKSVFLFCRPYCNVFIGTLGLIIFVESHYQ